MELAGLGSMQPYASQCYMSNEVYTTYAIYRLSVRGDGCGDQIYDIGSKVLVSRSFEPLATEPEVAQQLAKGTKEKSQTQGDEEYGEREDENRRDAAAFISPNRGPCCTT